MRAASAAAVLPVLALLLAGCTGGAAPAPSGSPLDDIEVEPASATMGAVAGLVVDETIRPILGAQVTVAGEVVAETNEDGVFVLDALEPGIVILGISAEGYLSVQTSADVVAGDTAEVRVQLPRDDRPQPYRVTYSHDGFMQAWGGIAQYFVENVGGGSGTCNCRVYFTPEPNATTLVYEAYWEDSVPDPAEMAEFYWVVDQPDGDGHEAGYCFSPCVQHIGFDGFSEGVETYARLDGADFWPGFQQSFQLFVTLWHNGEAPEGWTLASEGA